MELLLRLGDEADGQHSSSLASPSPSCPACEEGEGGVDGREAPVPAEEVQRVLGGSALMDVWARFQTCEGLEAALHGLAGCYISSVVGAGTPHDAARGGA